MSCLLTPLSRLLLQGALGYMCEAAAIPRTSKFAAVMVEYTKLMRFFEVRAAAAAAAARCRPCLPGRAAVGET